METNEPIYIRNMVCDRCRMVVRELFAELGIETRSVELGVVAHGGSGGGRVAETAGRTAAGAGIPNSSTNPGSGSSSR